MDDVQRLVYLSTHKGGFTLFKSFCWEHNSAENQPNLTCLSFQTNKPLSLSYFVRRNLYTPHIYMFYCTCLLSIFLFQVLSSVGIVRSLIAWIVEGLA